MPYHNRDSRLLTVLYGKSPTLKYEYPPTLSNCLSEGSAHPVKLMPCTVRPILGSGARCYTGRRVLEGSCLVRALEALFISFDIHKEKNRKGIILLLTGLCKVNCCRAEVKNLVQRASTSITYSPKSRRNNKLHNTFCKTWIVISIHILVSLDVLPRDLVL